VGELFFSSAGVGHLISLSTQTFNSPRLFACVLLFALSGVLLTAALYSLEQRLAPWRNG
jgi:NitT/TauT family transport system permease protein